MTMEPGRFEAMRSKTAITTHRYTLEVITPLMMHGWQEERIKENGKSSNTPLSAEFRPASIKGILRYWWRALQSCDVQTLISEEQKLFGGANSARDKDPDDPKSVNQSPLVIRNQIQTSRESTSVLPHRESKKGRSPCIPTGSTLQLEIQFLKKDLEKQQKILHYIDIIFMLAGFGQRSRRGGGALQNVSSQWHSIEDLQETLFKIIHAEQLDDMFKNPGVSQELLVQDPTVQTQHPALRTVWIGREFDKAEDARRQISKAGHDANPATRPQYLGKVDSKARIASPLHATVRRIGGNYYPVISEVITDHAKNNREYLKARDVFLQKVGVKI